MALGVYSDPNSAFRVVHLDGTKVLRRHPRLLTGGVRVQIPLVPLTAQPLAWKTDRGTRANLHGDGCSIEEKEPRMARIARMDVGSPLLRRTASVLNS
jgi:hypothetical protein